MTMKNPISKRMRKLTSKTLARLIKFLIKRVMKGLAISMKQRKKSKVKVKMTLETLIRLNKRFRIKKRLKI